MKKIEDYLHLYLGCQVSRGNKTDDTIQLTAGVLDNVMNVKGGIFSTIKLILRPLSDMTEEEKVKTNELSMEADVYKFQYLLSKHFDLFNLHEAGLCLYKNEKGELY